MSSVDEEFMLLAIEEGKKCSSVNTAYNVGAVLVSNGRILAKGFSRELPGNTHAEECALIKIQNVEYPENHLELTSDCDLYTTMEPCSMRLSGKVPCCQLVNMARIKRVIIGVREPPKFVNCQGADFLRNNGVRKKRGTLCTINYSFCEGLADIFDRA